MKVLDAHDERPEQERPEQEFCSRVLLQLELALCALQAHCGSTHITCEENPMGQ